MNTTPPTSHIYYLPARNRHRTLGRTARLIPAHHMRTIRIAYREVRKTSTSALATRLQLAPVLYRLSTETVTPDGEHIGRPR